MTAADIARELLTKLCPHPHLFVKRSGCPECLTAALTEHGDARAREEREACAALVMEFCTCSDAWTKRDRHHPEAECADRAAAIRARSK